MLQAYADCLSFTGPVLAKLAGFINARAPWALPEAKAMAEAAELAAVWQDADEMAKRIRLSLADREFLKVGTIGAVEVTKRKRKALQKEKRRQRETKRRRANGSKPRAQYEAESISRAKPWEAQGISKATYYRRLKQVNETGPCPPSSLYIGRHAVVSSSPCSGRDALRAGPTGLGPFGPRHSAQVEGLSDYFEEGMAFQAEVRL